MERISSQFIFEGFNVIGREGEEVMAGNRGNRVMCKDRKCIRCFPDVDGGVLKKCEGFCIFPGWSITPSEVEAPSAQGLSYIRYGNRNIVTFGPL